ncbi:hypothetical protein K9M47_03125 [Candidatus Gracilibacteria bacterium]|nr:hypothetical protein [Candidatus Gracilibacteria bacterium]
MQTKRITESGIITRGFGKLGKVTINSHSSGTLALYDAVEAGVQATGTLTSSGACVPASHGQTELTSSGAMVAGTHAVSVFTSSGVVVDGETITIGTTVYRAKAIPSQPYDVAMGEDAEAFLTNLYNAINGSGAGAYIGTAAHPDVVAVAKDATTITVRGRVPGTSLNATATTETFTNGSWADTTLGGGTGASDAGVTTGAATVTLGSITYTVVDELSETYGADAIAYQVKKGTAEANMLDNLKLAVNGGTGEGTLYSTGTVAHPYLIATTNTDTVQTFVSRTVGTAAEVAVINALATTETMANTAFADTTFGGGTGNSNPVVTSDAATITIGDITYTAVIELSETSGATAVPYQILWVTSEAVFLDNVKKAINASGVAGTDYSTGTYEHPQVYATTNTNTTQVVVSKTTGTSGNSIATTETLGNYAWGAATLASGSGADGKLMHNTMTFSAVATTGERILDFTEETFSNGLYAVIGGTADLTISYE